MLNSINWTKRRRSTMWLLVFISFTHTCIKRC